MNKILDILSQTSFYLSGIFFIWGRKLLEIKDRRAYEKSVAKKTKEK